MNMQKPEAPSLYLKLSSDWLTKFFYLLQTGFQLKIMVGKNVEATLTQEFGLDMELLDKIQTVFLDGKAVDNLESSLVKEGSILALSSAMPGLVGATLRRGSYYAAMRSHITAAKSEERAPSQEGMVTLKLFNLLMNQLGPIFLERGIWVERHLLQDFCTSLPPDFWANCRKARINACRMEPEAVALWIWPETDALIFLKVDPVAVRQDHALNEGQERKSSFSYQET
jgi:hypothetical protein